MKKHRRGTKPEEVLFPMDKLSIIFSMKKVKYKSWRMIS